MPDIVKKKKEVKDQILDGPKNVIAARTEVLENVQLGEEMKAALCWAVTSNNLPYWSEQLAKQRAILQGKSFASSGIINLLLQIQPLPEAHLFLAGGHNLHLLHFLN